MTFKPMPWGKFGYVNFTHLMKTEPNAEIIAHAEKNYDIWTRYLLKHKNCPDHITELYAKSPVWYHRFAAVLPKARYQRFKHLLMNDTDKRIQRAVQAAEEMKWGEAV